MLNQVRNLMGNQPSLDQFLEEARQTKGNNGWKNFISKWKYKDVCKLLPKYRSQIDTILDQMLNVTKHSIAFSYVVGFKSQDKMDDPNELRSYIQNVQTLLEKGDKNAISICPRPFSDSFRKFIEILRDHTNQTEIQIASHCKKAIQLLQGGDEHILTYPHSELMICCVHSRYYHLAFPYIQQEIISVQGDNSVKAKDNLLYHYYCGLIYIAVKDYDKALECFVFGLTSPSECLSCIQIECYKKYILLCLIQKQNLINLPRYTPNNLKRYYRKFANDYIDLVEAFQKGPQIFNKLVEKNSKLYIRDNNFGLIKQIINVIKKNAITKLTSVYTRLSIEKVAQLCHFENSNDAKQTLISMIRKNELMATFDHNGVVTFTQNPTQSDSKMLQNIYQRMKSSIELWNTLDYQQLDNKQTNSYVKKSLNIGNQGPNNGDGEMNQMHMLGGFGFRG